MATTQTSQYASIANPAVQGLLTANTLGSPLGTAFFAYTCQSEAVGDIIKLTRLPAGARFLGLGFACESLAGAFALLNIGWTDDPDGMNGFAVANQIPFSFTAISPQTEVPNTGFGYVFTQATDIIATVDASSVSALNTNMFWGCILYAAN